VLWADRGESVTIATTAHSASDGVVVEEAVVRCSNGIIFVKMDVGQMKDFSGDYE